MLGVAVAYGQRECVDILLAGASPIAHCGIGSDQNTVLHVVAMARGGLPVLTRLMSTTEEGEPFDPLWLELRNR